MTRNSRLDGLRSVALAIVVVAAIGSSGLMLHVGEYRMNLLMLLFAVWDLSPFAALFVAGIVSSRWPPSTRTALYTVMLLVAAVAAVSLIVYGRVVLNRPAQPAFAFLMVPLGSWVLSIVVVLVVHAISTKNAGRHQPLFRA